MEPFRDPEPATTTALRRARRMAEQGQPDLGLDLVRDALDNGATLKDVWDYVGEPALREIDLPFALLLADVRAYGEAAESR